MKETEVSNKSGIPELKDTWIRCKAAGKMASKIRYRGQIVGWIAAIMAAITATTLFATLQQSHAYPARWIAGALAVIAAVVSAIQIKLSKDDQEALKACVEAVKIFDPLHRKLLNEILRDTSGASQSTTGKANTALTDWNSNHPDQFPTYGEAVESVNAELKKLGLLKDH